MLVLQLAKDVKRRNCTRVLCIFLWLTILGGYGISHVIFEQFGLTLVLDLAVWPDFSVVFKQEQFDLTLV